MKDLQALYIILKELQIQKETIKKTPKSTELDAGQRNNKVPDYGCKEHQIVPHRIMQTLS